MVSDAKEELKRLRKLEGKKKELAQLQAEWEWRQKNRSIYYYRPHVKQDAFHRDLSRKRLILGGNRSGKSLAAVNEGVAHVLGFRPWLKPEDPDYKVDVKVPNRGLIVGESFGEQVKKVLVTKLLGDPELGTAGALPTEEVEGVKRNQQGIVTFVKLKKGSTIDLQSYDQEVSLFEGTQYDWAYFDEPPPRPIYIAVQRGLTDSIGFCWLALTPLKEPWIYDELVCRDDVGKHTFDIEDNLGFGLSRKGIDEFTRNLTEDEKECRLRGRFFHLSGLVYKLYGPINRIKRVPIQRHWGMWMHIDSHPRTPHHAVWMTILPDGKKFVCGALKNSHPSNLVAPFAEAIKVYEAEILKRRGDEIVRLIEPGSATPNPTKDGLSIKDEFEKYGIYCRPGSKNRDAGILRLQSELQYDPSMGTYPNLYFFEDLAGVHDEMTHYVWDDWQQRQGWGRTEKQKPKDKDDHFIEGIHRILLDEPEYPGMDLLEEPVGASAGSTANPVTGY